MASEGVRKTRTLLLYYYGGFYESWSCIPRARVPIHWNGEKIYDRYQCVKKIFNEADEILGYDLQNLCFYGDSKMLQQSGYTQPAVFITSYAAYIAFVDEYGIKPVCLAGHSMGEITALVCANAIDFRRGLQMISQRGRFMQE